MRVLNPRPVGQSEALTLALQQAGYDVIALPLLAIVPLVPTEEARHTLMNIDQYAGVVFVSANAAREGLAAMTDYWPQWPDGVHYIAVGPSTADVLLAQGIKPLVPRQFDSEGMLAMPELQAVAGQRWLIIRARQGRNLLRDTLTQRGAQVDVLSLYDVVRPAEASEQWRQLVYPPDVVLLTSAQVWQHWQQVAQDRALAPILLTVSERLAQTARAAGARRVVCAAGADTASWLSALNQLKE